MLRCTHKIDKEHELMDYKPIPAEQFSQESRRYARLHTSGPSLILSRCLRDVIGQCVDNLIRLNIPKQILAVVKQRLVAEVDNTTDRSKIMTIIERQFFEWESEGIQKRDLDILKEDIRKAIS